MHASVAEECWSMHAIRGRDPKRANTCTIGHIRKATNRKTQIRERPLFSLISSCWGTPRARYLLRARCSRRWCGVRAVPVAHMPMPCGFSSQNTLTECAAKWIICLADEEDAGRLKAGRVAFVVFECQMATRSLRRTESTTIAIAVSRPHCASWPHVEPTITTAHRARRPPPAVAGEEVPAERKAPSPTA